MPIDTPTLESVVRRFTSPMTSIRGRRVQRLLLRAFARFDHVVPAAAEDGAPVLLALAEDGGAAMCASDGSGPTAEVVAWSALSGASVSSAHDLLKDSLPLVRWTLRHPGLARVGGALTISAAGLEPGEQARVAGLLGRLAGQASGPGPRPPGTVSVRK